MITIVDYGAGNIKSIQNMLRKLGVTSLITSDAKTVANADKLILPGVGHFDYGMQNLKKSGLLETMNKKVLEEKCPILGICLGAQLLGNSSEEGEEPGLGWIDMEVVKFDRQQLGSNLKVPHMGWNYIQPGEALELDTHQRGLFDGLSKKARFYFVHTYHMLPKQSSNVLSTTTYGYEFASSVQKDNIYGVQFHPEKSHQFGMHLLKNFTELS